MLRIKTLTETDFPEAGLNISGSGEITVPPPFGNSLTKVTVPKE